MGPATSGPEGRQHQALPVLGESCGQGRERQDRAVTKLPPGQTWPQPSYCPHLLLVAPLAESPKAKGQWSQVTQSTGPRAGIEGWGVDLGGDRSSLYWCVLRPP